MSAPQPDFEHDGVTFSKCLLLHRLLATGQEEVVLQRRQELPSLVNACADYVQNNYQYEQQTPLHFAARWNPSADVIRALLDKGADIEARDKYQNTPLHEAAINNPGQVKLLLERGANVNVLARWQR